METLHGSLGAPLLQRINNTLFENGPVIEGLDSEEVDQGEKLLDLVLTVTEISSGRALATR